MKKKIILAIIVAVFSAIGFSSCSGYRMVLTDPVYPAPGGYYPLYYVPVHGTYLVPPPPPAHHVHGPKHHHHH